MRGSTMDGEKKKEGVSVREIENFAKKHYFELFFCILFILASLFSFVFWGPGWSVMLAGAGGVIAVFFTGKVEFMSKKVHHFVFKQDRTVQIVLAVVALVIAILLPPLVFFSVGLHAGKSMYHQAMEIASQYRKD